MSANICDMDYILVTRLIYHLECCVNNLVDGILKYLSNFSRNIGSDISCKLPTEEIICMKGESLFSKTLKRQMPSIFRLLNLLLEKFKWFKCSRTPFKTTTGLRSVNFGQFNAALKFAFVCES